MSGYEKGQLLGQGTYGNVFKGRDKKTGVPVAIKDIKSLKGQPGQDKV